MKRIFSILLSVALFFSVFETVNFQSVYATSKDNDVVEQGNCGDKGNNVTYKLYKDGSLVIEGNGRMTGYTALPWYSYANKIKKMYIRKNITWFNIYAINGCVKLTSITVDNKNKYYSTVNGILYDKSKTTLIYYPANKSGSIFKIPSKVSFISFCAFEESQNLKTVEISNTVKMVGKHIFNRSSIEYLTIPSSIKIMMDGFFYFCGNLKKVVIPKTVQAIGINSFDYCKRLKDIYYGGNRKQWKKLVDNCDFLEERISNVRIHYNYKLTGKTSGKVVFPTINICSSVYNGIKIGWKKVKGVDKYRVYRKVNGKWKKYCDTNKNYIIYNKVKSGKKYTFNVISINKYGCSKMQNGRTVTYFNAPKILKITNAFNGAKLQWSKVKGISKYKILYRPNTKKNWKILGTSYTNSFIDYNAPMNNRYYTVRCLNSNGKNCSGINPKGKLNCFHMAQFIRTITTVKNGIKIQWDGEYKIPKYRVLLKTNKGWKKLVDTKSTTFVHKNPKAGHIYQYCIRSLNKKGKYISGYYIIPTKIKYKMADKVRDRFINELMNNQSQWLPKGSSPIGRGYAAGFEFTDIDFDGVNELVVQEEGGSLMNRDAVVFSFKDNKIVKYDGVFQNTLNYYYNKLSKQYEIHGIGTVSSGPFGFWQGNFRLNIDNDSITSNYYAAFVKDATNNTYPLKYKYRFYNGASGYMNEDSSDKYKIISKKEYNTILNDELKNCVNIHKNTQIIYKKLWTKMSYNQRKQALLDSYNVASYNKK